MLAYTECINLLNYSACVIPVSTANKDIDVFDKGYRPLNETDRKNWEACKFGNSKREKEKKKTLCLEMAALKSNVLTILPVFYKI